MEKNSQEIAATPGDAAPASLRDMIVGQLAELTASERKIANVILADYPYGGLMPIQELAQAAGVSAPSITRFVAKIGCAGFQDFQRQLIGALKQRELSPVELKLTEAPPKGAHFLADYTHRLMHLMTQMADTLPVQPVDEACRLIGDPARNIFLLGGRVTDSLARLLSVHLRQIRARVHHLPSDPEQWPDHVLRMRKQDVVILFDMRRYERRLADLAAVISGTRGSVILAVTDRWLSPISQHATLTFALPTDLRTPWDTHVCMLTLIEAIILRVAELDWPSTRSRIGQWDAIRNALPRTGLKSDDLTADSVSEARQLL